MKAICPLLLALLCLPLSACESLFFYPEEHLRYHPDICAAEPENVLFKSADGTLLHGWYFQPEGEPRGVVMFLHGNAQNISLHMHSMLWLIDAGYAVFTFDYRGYGISKGKPNINGVVEDSLAAFDYLLSRDLPSDKVIILGQSMGAALALNLAARTEHQERVGAVIADSPFSSWRGIYREKAGQIVLTWAFQYPISWFISDKHAPIKYVGQIPPEVPILLIHDKQDVVVGYAHSEKIFEATEKRAELWLSNGMGHIRAMNHPDMQKRILDYLNRIRLSNIS